MSSICITVKGLANFMTANAARQRKVVRDFKFPDPEGAAQAKYYREARRIVRDFHRNERSADWLIARADRLEQEARSAAGKVAERLRNNARGVRAYAAEPPKRHYTILETPRLAVVCGPVLVKVTPDLYVLDGETERLIKLEFAKDEPDDRVVKIVCQVMFQAAENAGMALKPASICYHDVPRRTTHKGAKARTRLAGDIEAACQTIADIWPGIGQAPRRKAS